jgi:hypothetical protein
MARINTYPKSEIGFMQTSVIRLPRLKKRFTDQVSMSLSSQWHQFPYFHPYKTQPACTSDTPLPLEAIRSCVPVGWFT